MMGDRSLAAQTQRNHRPMCSAPDNNAEAIIILYGHLKGPDTSANRPRQDVAAPVNTALSDLHPDHSTTSSLCRHLTSSAASSLTHATQQVADDIAWICQGTWPALNDAPARTHADVRRNWSKCNTSSHVYATQCRRSIQLRRRPDGRHLYRYR